MAPWNISISKGNPMPCISSLSDNFTHGTILDTPQKTYEYWFRKWNEFFFFVPFSFFFFTKTRTADVNFRREGGGRRILDCTENNRKAEAKDRSEGRGRRGLKIEARLTIF